MLKHQNYMHQIFTEDANYFMQFLLFSLVTYTSNDYFKYRKFVSEYELQFWLIYKITQRS